MIHADQDLAKLFLARTPFLDVRAPIEFAAGSAPGAVNLPLLNDNERAAVGIEYKERGQESAIALGHNLVSGREREMRVAHWLEFVRQNPNARLYCFRGGLRSQLVRSALLEKGVDLPLIPGGYKRLRAFFLATIERLVGQEKFVVLTGLTGAGKTLFLRAHAEDFRHCDLEALAEHRGSAFGRTPKPQPSLADFENRLAVQLLEVNASIQPGPIVLEDESRTIGKLVLPRSLFGRMAESPLVVLERPREKRARLLVSTYLEENYHLRNGDRDEMKILQLSQDLDSDLKAIGKRLGGAELRTIQEMVRSAIAEQLASGKFSTHYEWVDRLLARYYDPVYERHLEREKDRIVFRGGSEDILGWLSHRHGASMLSS